VASNPFLFLLSHADARSRDHWDRFETGADSLCDCVSCPPPLHSDTRTTTGFCSWSGPTPRRAGPGRAEASLDHKKFDSSASITLYHIGCMPSYTIRCLVVKYRRVPLLRHLGDLVLYTFFMPESRISTVLLFSRRRWRGRADGDRYYYGGVEKKIE
jgi:hypothetical protein